MMILQKKLSMFGFSHNQGGAHTSRTIMLAELQALLSTVSDLEATPKEYRSAIVNDNCLSKRTENTRVLTFKHLVELYALDPRVTIFRAFLYFWQRDPSGRPLIALLSAYARDPILRAATPLLLSYKDGDAVTRQSLENYLDDLYPSRFSPGTLKSTAQNLNSSWTKTGHLAGKAYKTRTQVTATAGSLAYALFLGYLSGLEARIC